MYCHDYLSLLLPRASLGPVLEDGKSIQALDPVKGCVLLCVLLT